MKIGTFIGRLEASRHMAVYVCVTLLALLLTACEAKETESRETKDDGSGFTEFKEESERTVNELKRMLTDLTPSKDSLKSMTTEELAKLSIFEYHVFDLPKEATPDELEQSLSTAGRDRWDCFGVVPTEKMLRIFCQRRPETYLRYIPRFFP